MKRNRTVSDDYLPGERRAVSQGRRIHPPPGSIPSHSSRRYGKARSLTSLLLVFASLAIPGPAPAFNLGQMFKDAAESIQKQITDKTKDKVDEGEKQVEEGIDTL